MPTNFLTVEEKLAAITRILSECTDEENAEFISRARLLVQKTLSAHRTQTQLARRSEHAQPWTN